MMYADWKYDIASLYTLILLQLLKSKAFRSPLMPERHGPIKRHIEDIKRLTEMSSVVR